MDDGVPGNVVSTASVGELFKCPSGFQRRWDSRCQTPPFQPSGAITAWSELHPPSRSLQESIEHEEPTARTVLCKDPLPNQRMFSYPNSLSVCPPPGGACENTESDLNCSHAVHPRISHTPETAGGNSWDAQHARLGWD